MPPANKAETLSDKKQDKKYKSTLNLSFLKK